MQPDAAILWRNYLVYACSGRLSKVVDFRTLTILDTNWHFGERNWQFNLNKVKHKTRKSLKGLNYIVIVDFDIYRNYHYKIPVSGPLFRERDFGRLIAPHIHGIIWGPRLSLERRAKFAGGLFGAPAVKEVKIYHFGGASLYMVKPPYRGKSIVTGRNNKYGRRPWNDMYLTSHHLLLTHLGGYSYPDLTFAGGDGCAVLKEAKRLWKKDIRATERKRQTMRPQGIFIDGIEWIGDPNYCRSERK
ncbi:MAG TPA: hypothetical protein VM755_05175 [Stellaceae bacterium]|nr:hypothetical protein [Stellaceae bacterium]